jgi:hypothetical protein
MGMGKDIHHGGNRPGREGRGCDVGGINECRWKEITSTLGMRASGEGLVQEKREDRDFSTLCSISSLTQGLSVTKVFW